MRHARGPAPAIHFVIPFLGSADYLSQSVDSVADQTDPHWLLTVLEDGPHASLDTDAWRRRFADPRVSRVTNPERLGIGRNFQRALECAHAPWLVVLGYDDVLAPDYVAVVRRAIEDSPGADVVQPGVRVIDADGRPHRTTVDAVKRLLRRLHPGRVTGGDRLAASLMHGNWLYFPSLCWRTDAIAPIGFRQDLPTTLDLALVADLLLAGGRLLRIDDPVFRYRRHSTSASSAAASSLVRFDEERRLFDELAGRFEAHGWTRAARAARWHVTSRAHRVLAGGHRYGGAR